MAEIRIDYIRNGTDYIALTQTSVRSNDYLFYVYGQVYNMIDGELIYKYGEYFSPGYLAELDSSNSDYILSESEMFNSPMPKGIVVFNRE